MPGKPLRTRAIVLRRTNYGETDRILNLLTPEGQKAVRARGVRREKSKLAGGIEMFSLSDVVIQPGHSEMGTLTSAKMVEFYQGVLADLERLELASQLLRDVSRATSQIDSPEFFSITEQALSALNCGAGGELVRAWFTLNLRRVSGDEINLVRDKTGAKLVADRRYNWDSFAEVFVPAENGEFSADHIKLLRLMVAAPLETVQRVKNLDEFLSVATGVVR